MTSLTHCDALKPGRCQVQARAPQQAVQAASPGSSTTAAPPFTSCCSPGTTPGLTVVPEENKMFVVA